MNSKTFYIPPSETMNSDMSEYFKAVEEISGAHPHTYECSDGEFELAVTMIVAAMNRNKESKYRVEDILKDMNPNDVEILSTTLQQLCDSVKKNDKQQKEGKP